MQETHGLVVKIHPLLISRVDKVQLALDEFKAMVSSYKPKITGIEVGIIKAKDQTGLDIMSTITKQQKQAVENKRVRMEMHHKLQVARQKQVEILE